MPRIRERSGGELRAHTGEVMSVSFLPDGQMLAFGSRDKSAVLRETDKPLPVEREPEVRARRITSLSGLFPSPPAPQLEAPAEGGAGAPLQVVDAIQHDAG